MEELEYMTPKEYRVRLKKLGIKFKSFSEYIGTNPLSFNSKASFDKKYIRLLELLEENNRLKKIVQGIAIIDKHNIPSRKK